MNSIQSTASIEAGAAVMSADGKKLGIVKDVREDRFLVDVRWAPDYWLGVEAVDNTSADLVQLLITREAVGSAKLHNGGIDDGNLPSRM